jgi:hypothetical protein
VPFPLKLLNTFLSFKIRTKPQLQKVYDKGTYNPVYKQTTCLAVVQAFLAEDNFPPQTLARVLEAQK